MAPNSTTVPPPREAMRSSREGVWTDSARRAAATRAGLRALDIELVPKDGFSESVTAAWVPDGIDGAHPQVGENAGDVRVLGSYPVAVL